MSNSTAIAATPQAGSLAQFSREQMDVIKNHIAKGCTDIELQYFLSVAQRSGLDPFAKQIYMIKRKEQQEDGTWKETATPQCSIDGYRLIADESGEYNGSRIHWCGKDGAWRDVWLADEAPAAAKCEVFKKGCEQPFVAIAKFNSYAQRKKDGTPSKFWRTMPAEQLAKCAESLALRKAFPKKTSGIYTSDEMAQSDNPEPNSAVKELMKAEVVAEKPETADLKLNIGGTHPEAANCISITETKAIQEFIKGLGNNNKSLAIISKHCSPDKIGTLSPGQAGKLVSELAEEFGVTHEFEWRDF